MVMEDMPLFRKEYEADFSTRTYQGRSKNEVAGACNTAEDNEVRDTRYMFEG
jgi:hypothetical protein